MADRNYLYNIFIDINCDYPQYFSNDHNSCSDQCPDGTLPDNREP